MNMNLSNGLSFRGEISIVRENMETGEQIEWCRSHNTLVISGCQWILMKMFGLYLDSKHDPSDVSRYEVLSKDSTIAIPDLNARSSLPIGKQVSTYTKMEGDIAANHICQGFMVGNRGAAEDSITTKNTDYSFVALRNPIPFQQTNESSLDPSIAGKYLGLAHISSTSSNDGFSKSYYIKKFDERPHIYHSWWRENQKWDYIDPVSVTDLGPNSTTANKTNRIETYVECKLSLSDNDCFAYFQHAGMNETPAINELGLVAFDTEAGARSEIEALYNSDIKQLLSLLYDNKRDNATIPELIRLANSVFEALNNIKVGTETRSITSFGNTNINAFMATLEELGGETVERITEDPTVLEAYQNAFAESTNIGVEALYNQKGDFIYETDGFITALETSSFDSLGTDEAQRIKLITYYTFNSIPLQKNWRTLINYRIYAN